jgi:hypothetical protein
MLLNAPVRDSLVAAAEIGRMLLNCMLLNCMLQRQKSDVCSSGRSRTAPELLKESKFA